jgi:DNA-binding NarL/FixJ family response regulator
MSIRTLLADDHHLMREGLAALIGACDGFEVVAQASSGRAAVRCARDLKPDVVIMEATLPELGGVEAARQIKSYVPNAKVVALSMQRDGEMVLDMLKAGASAYVLKTCSVEELVRALRAVSAGQTYLGPEIAGIVTDAYISGPSGAEGPGKAALTPRQREVVQLLAEGVAAKEIALRLKRSIKTVEMHRRNAMGRLNLSNMADLVRYALRKGLVRLDP